MCDVPLFFHCASCAPSALFIALSTASSKASALDLDPLYCAWLIRCGAPCATTCAFFTRATKPHLAPSVPASFGACPFFHLHHLDDLYSQL
jgi:hypothetical protein